MKDRQGIIITAVSGIFFLVALFFQPRTSVILNLVINWTIILSSVALLVAFVRLIATHMRHIAVGRRGFLFSLVFFAAFATTFIAGMFMGEGNPEYLKWIRAVQLPIETAVLGLLALVLMSLAAKVFRERGWSVLTISFGTSTLFFLFLNLGFLKFGNNTGLDKMIIALRRLPVIGARGLLIGIALGALVMGLRVLFGQVVENE
jgi:hypothetical protein